MTNEKTVSEAINYRRSVRIFDAEKPIETSLVKKCIEQASLAPNSSNMQLWEFYESNFMKALSVFNFPLYGAYLIGRSSQLQRFVIPFL